MGERSDVFVHDRQDGSTERVSLDENGAEFDGQSWVVALSADGGTVAFELWVVPFPGYNATALYVRDWQGAPSQLVASHGMGGEFEPALSQDGRFLAYDYREDVFSPFSSQVYVLDRQSGAAGVVSVSSAGVKGDNLSASASISADGRYVAFLSHATNLVPGDTNGFADIFVHDRSSGDTNNAFDVFVHDLTIAFPPLATYCTAKTNSLGCAPTIGASGLPELTGNDAFFVVAERILSNKIGMLFWGLAPASAPFAGGTLCIQQPLIRTPIQPSGGNPPPDDCSGTYSFHFSQAYMAANGLAPGTTVYAQYWSRDPGFAPPQNIGLTDALRFTTCP